MASAEPVEGDVGYAPALTIKWLDHLGIFHAEQSPITVGRPENSHAQIQIPDNRISREHITLTAQRGQWVAEVAGRNGAYIGSARVERTFDVPHDSEVDVMLGHPDAGIPMSFSTRDPVNVFVGEQIARRRKELLMSQRALAEGGVVNAGALIAIEKGRSQPRPKTENALEDALQWPRGRIEQLRLQMRAQLAGRAGGGAPSAPMVNVDSEERTELLRPAPGGEATTTVEVTLVTETIAVALDSMRGQIAALPASDQQSYPGHVATVISGLTRLEALAASASHSSVGMLRELAEIRRVRRDLLLAAANSPYATVGQRLYAARRRTELKVEEAAAMAGVNAEDITKAEFGTPVDDEIERRLRRLIAALATDTGTRTAG